MVTSALSPIRLTEAEPLDREAYRAALRETMNDLDRLNVKADRQVIDLFSGLRRQTQDIVSELGDTPSGPLYQRTLEGIDQSMTDFANRWGFDFESSQLDAFDLGADLTAGPLEAGYNIDLLRLGPTTDQLRILAQFRTDLVGGVTTELSKRIKNEVAGVLVGARSFTDAAEAIGRNLTDRNHFSTMMHRARAILVTEIGRAQALSTQSTQEQAAEVLPGLRKRWLNAHLANPRQSHLAAEARYAENGIVGPIAIDEPYTIGGHKAMWPHDPSLPASESVHCHCVSISVLIEPGATPEPVDPADPDLIPLTDQDEERLDDDPGVALTPRQIENRVRYERLEQPMKKPRNWSTMSNRKRLNFIEQQMEADFPIGEEYRSQVITQKRQRVPVTMRDGSPVLDLRTGKQRTRMTTIRETILKVKGSDLKTTFALTGDPDLLFAEMNELRRMSMAFPEVAERLSYVGGYRGAKSLEWKVRSARQFAGEMAHASNDGRRLGLNPSFYTKPERITNAVRSSWSSGFHPVNDVPSNVVHEFGHLVENWLVRENNRSLITFGSRVDGFGSVGSIRNGLLDAFARVSRGDALTPGISGPGGYLQVSRYAAKNGAEGWAETFTSYWYRKNNIRWSTGGGRIPSLSQRLSTPTAAVVKVPAFVTGARPITGPLYGDAAETLIGRFTKFMDVLEGVRLQDLPSITTLFDTQEFRALSLADQITHLELRNQLIADLGGSFGPYEPIDIGLLSGQ
mgnify:CR=1 FL=1